MKTAYDILKERGVVIIFEHGDGFAEGLVSDFIGAMQEYTRQFIDKAAEVAETTDYYDHLIVDKSSILKLKEQLL